MDCLDDMDSDDAVGAAGDVGAVDDVIALFRAPFETFVDYHSNGSTVQPCDEFVGDVFARYLALALSTHEFGKGLGFRTLDRAKAFVELAGPFVASTEFERVADYIAREPLVLPLPIAEDLIIDIYARKARLELEDVAAAVRKAHGRFIAEMSIEFNQIEEREGALIREHLQEPGPAVEYLKSRFHNTWRNVRDFNWIGKSMPDVRREYAKLDTMKRLS